MIRCRLCLDSSIFTRRVLSLSLSLSLSRMAFWDLSDSQRMGAGLIGFAFFFILLGFSLFFDRALLALGNIFLIVGVILLLVCLTMDVNSGGDHRFFHLGHRSSTNIFRATGSFDRLGMLLRWYCLAAPSMAHRRRHSGSDRILQTLRWILAGDHLSRSLDPGLWLRSVSAVHFYVDQQAGRE